MIGIRSSVLYRNKLASYSFIHLLMEDLGSVIWKYLPVFLHVKWDKITSTTASSCEKHILGTPDGKGHLDFGRCLACSPPYVRDTLQSRKWWCILKALLGEKQITVMATADWVMVNPCKGPTGETLLILQGPRLRELRYLVQRQVLGGKTMAKSVAWLKAFLFIPSCLSLQGKRRSKPQPNISCHRPLWHLSF